MKLDPITLEVVWSRLISLVDEAAANLVRTSFSTVVRESNDYACVITDKNGNSLVQSSLSIPSFISTLPQTVKEMLKVYPKEELKAGDVLITNNPWLGTGHLPDINIVVPIFSDNHLIGFSATVAHSPDIGGRIRSPEAGELFEEGLQIPIDKLIVSGKQNYSLINIIRENVRVPDMVMGDIWAQITANQTAGKGLLNIMKEYNLKDIKNLAHTIQNRSEQAIRDEIRKLPDGEYNYSVSGDGVETPIHIQLNLTIENEDIYIDYAGTSEQIPRALNVVLAYTFAYTVYPIKCILSPDIPNNEGCFRPIHVQAPEGTILNPKYPASVGARALTGHLLPPAIFGVFSSIVPDQVQAASGSPLWAVHMAGKNKGKRYASVFFFNGGQGASLNQDGYPCLSFPSNVSATPVEVLEKNFPIHIHEKSLREDSGGNGQFRGGLGQRLVIEHVGDSPANISFMAERIKNPAFGLLGGGSGHRGRVLLNDKEINPKDRYIMSPGDILICETPGGGGFGNPENRKKESLLLDLKNQYVVTEDP